MLNGLYVCVVYGLLVDVCGLCSVVCGVLVDVCGLLCVVC